MLTREGINMKKATEKVLGHMPFLKEHYEGKATKGLSKGEKVFLKLIYFFESPKTKGFDLREIYNHLDNDWLEFALECIHTYFLEDTYLVTNPSHSLITDGDYYLGQTSFAEYLNENGVPFDRAKMSKYISRGKIPEADVIINGVKYWERITCNNYLDKLKNN